MQDNKTSKNLGTIVKEQAIMYALPNALRPDKLKVENRSLDSEAWRTAGNVG